MCLFYSLCQMFQSLFGIIVPLLCRLMEPLHSFALIFWDAESVCVYGSSSILREFISSRAGGRDIRLLRHQAYKKNQNQEEMKVAHSFLPKTLHKLSYVAPCQVTAA